MDNSNQGPSASNATPSGKKTILTLALIISLVVIGYHSVLFDFFVGDDFVHLIWLKKAMADPSLILRNFNHNWLDITTTSFYRPLISVFMALDYAIWKVNGLGFHLTNLFFHLLATVTIFYLAKGLFDDVSKEDNKIADQTRASAAYFYGSIAALIFGIYPLHCEAVAWITGRVDTIVTAFICLALYFYRCWRQKEKRLYLGLTLLFCICGLLSKEMAITLPFIFLVYSFLIENHPKESTLTKRILSSLKASSLFFVLLFFYFILRYFSLGTFVGGYDNSVLPTADIAHFIKTWLHGLRMFLIPLNREIISSSNPVTYVWIISLICTFGLFLYNLITSSIYKKLSLFNFLFLLLAFLPVYKLFAIANDLQGSRLAHVATIALALLIATAFATPLAQWDKKLLYARKIVLGIYIGLCATGLIINNSAWAQAGHEANAIREELARIYSGFEDDPQVLLFNLPDNINGAYVTRNALDGMTKAPQFKRDIHNCLLVNSPEYITPFGYLKKSLQEEADKIKIFCWQGREKTFKKVTIKKEQNYFVNSWGASELQQVFPDQEVIDEVLILEQDREYELNLKETDCFDFEVLRLWIEEPKVFSDNAAVVLYFTNTQFPEFNNARSMVRKIYPNQAAAGITFPLYSRPDWTLGGKLKKIKLKFLGVKSPRITTLEAEKKQNLMPELYFENSSYLGSKGFIHLSQEKRSANLFVNSSNVQYAQSSLITISKPNKYFSTLNANFPQSNLLHALNKDLTTRFKITREMFPSDGIYQLRAWGIGKNGKVQGVAGDHIVISVDN